MTYRIVIADNYAYYRRSVQVFLKALPSVEFVGEADSAISLIEIVTARRANIVILDVHLEGNGLAAISKVSAPPLDCHCIVASLDVSPPLVRRAIVEGASGYLLKESLESDLPAALDLMKDGGLVFSAGVRSALQSSVLECPVRMFPQLTNRESDVLAELAKGASNGEIAAALFLSPKTVANHISSILEKLDEPDRAALIHRARANGSS